MDFEDFANKEVVVESSRVPIQFYMPRNDKGILK
jgi:hypothetical protein